MLKNWAIILFIASSFSAVSQNKSNLVVEVKNIVENKGYLYIYLYRTKVGFPVDPTKAYKKKIIKVNFNSTTISIKNIPNGSYAVSIYHDINSNKKLDTNFFGIPSEPTAVSNDAKGFMGPPSFNDAKFYLKTDKQISIQLIIQ